MIDRHCAIFRANPQYELICADEPESAEPPVLGEEFYGFFGPRVEGLVRRKASTTAALLYLTLSEPRSLPRYIALKHSLTPEQLLGLVYDGIIEIEIDGRFVSGATATALFGGRRREAVNRLGELSIEALRYAQTLSGLSADEIAWRLYLYGSLPARPELYRRFPSEESLLAHVVTRRDGVERYWQEAAPRGRNDIVWRKWYARSAKAPEEARYKLYISPAFEGIRGIVDIIASALHSVPGACGFKVGRNIETVCRPDKVIAYFSNADGLRLAADRLTQSLGGRQAQGVPFTCQITVDGLLSWGADPHIVDAVEVYSDSWRYWIVTRLANYLKAATGTPGSMEPWEFSVERLALTGIDTERWAPGTADWLSIQSRS